MMTDNGYIGFLARQGGLRSAPRQCVSARSCLRPPAFSTVAKRRRTGERSRPCSCSPRLKSFPDIRASSSTTKATVFALQEPEYRQASMRRLRSSASSPAARPRRAFNCFCSMRPNRRSSMPTRTAPHHRSMMRSGGRRGRWSGSASSRSSRCSATSRPQRHDSVGMALSWRSRLAAPSAAPVVQWMKKISYSGYRFPPEIIQQAI
jgi:hypothetical protein